MAERPIHIIADNKIPFLRGALEAYARINYLEGAQIRSEDVKNADAMILRTRTRCDESLLRGSRVQFIATATIGHDHIDHAYCLENGIKWRNAPGCNAGSVMQYVASALARMALKENFDLAKKTMGIIGHGHVGTKVHQLAKVLGMQVLINDPPLQRAGTPGDFVSLEEIKKEADIISFHVPLNRTGIDKTLHMADEAFFQSLPKKCLLINSSRGEVVESKALKKAIKGGKVHAILDVWENEPNIDLELLDLLSFATPHIAGYSADGKAMGTAMSVQAISQHFNLPLKDWFPENIPAAIPSNNHPFELDYSSEQESILRAILTSYDIQEDDLRLRASTQDFEKQRGNYPVRREFAAYTIKVDPAKIDLIQKLKALGFRIQNEI